MKALILSDIHGASENAREVIDRHPEAEYVFFLGDGEREFSRLSDFYPMKGFIGVRGNCDLFFFGSGDRLPETRVFDLCGVKLFMTHGHLTGTDESVLAYTAYKNGAQIALYGHTHIPSIWECKMGVGDVTVFNPGSIGNPRGGSDYGYGILEIKNGKYTLKHNGL